MAHLQVDSDIMSELQLQTLREDHNEVFIAAYSILVKQEPSQNQNEDTKTIQPGETNRDW